MVDFKIPEEEVRAMMGMRILDALTQETREDLIKQAIKHLIEPNRSGYGDRRSPVQVAFDQALIRLADKLADEVVQESGVAEKVRAAFGGIIETLPDAKDDPTLQAKFLQAVLDRAKEVRSDSYS